MKNPVIIGAPTAAHPVTVKRDGPTVGQRATSHTETPWRLRYQWEGGPPSVIEGNLQNPRSDGWYGRWVCTFEKQFEPEQTLANAEHIVKCVNAHDELLAFVLAVGDYCEDSPMGDRARDLLAKVRA